MSTTCPVNHCNRPKKKHELACREHWFRLPREVRDEVWQLWRDARGTDEQRDVAFRAIEFLNAAEAPKPRQKSLGLDTAPPRPRTNLHGEDES